MSQTQRSGIEAGEAERNAAAYREFVQRWIDRDYAGMRAFVGDGFRRSDPVARDATPSETTDLLRQVSWVEWDHGGMIARLEGR